jgi:hypothetical protein
MQPAMRPPSPTLSTVQAAPPPIDTPALEAGLRCEAELVSERRRLQDVKRKLEDGWRKLEDKTQLIDNELYEIRAGRLQGLRAVDDELESLLQVGVDLPSSSLDRELEDRVSDSPAL